MTTDSRMQQLLETLVSTQETESDVPQIDGRTFASALTERKTTGWDPHEVWLHRIKEPRDHRGVSGR